jgi:multidrug efflux pump subunit AcrB
VLKISGLPIRADVSSSAATQNQTSIVLDNRQLSTVRLAQSMIATQLEEATADGQVGDVRCPPLVWSVDPQAARQVWEYPAPERRRARPRLRSPIGSSGASAVISACD